MKTFFALIGWLAIMGAAIVWLLYENHNENGPWIVGAIGGVGLVLIFSSKKKK